MKLTLWGGTVCVLLLLGFNTETSEAQSSGVSTTKQMGDVTQQEANKMCKAYAKVAKETRKGNCTLNAIEQAADEKECKAIRTECLDSIEAEPTETNECADVDIAELEGFAALVGEVESCLSELVSYMKSLDCSQIGSALPDKPLCMEALQKQYGRRSALQ